MSDYDPVSEAACLVVLKIGSCTYVDEWAAATALRAAYDAGSREADASRMRSALAHVSALSGEWERAADGEVANGMWQCATDLRHALEEAGDE